MEFINFILLEYFYNITTSKADMKQSFDEHNVTNAAWQFIESINSIDEKIFYKIAPCFHCNPSSKIW
jgi:hypothetical protein